MKKPSSKARKAQPNVCEQGSLRDAVERVTRRALLRIEQVLEDPKATAAQIREALRAHAQIMARLPSALSAVVSDPAAMERAEELEKSILAGIQRDSERIKELKRENEGLRRQLRAAR